MTGATVTVDSAEGRAYIAAFLSATLGRRLGPTVAVRPLSGGAIQENWLIEVQRAAVGAERFVLRKDSPSTIAASLGRADEFALLKVAHSAGVTVPRPTGLCRQPNPLASDFAIMSYVPGTAAGHVLTRDDKWTGDRTALGRRLGRELARLHRVSPATAVLDFLPEPAPDHADACIRRYSAYLDAMPRAWPVLRWGLAWLARNRPTPHGPVLIHRDFRTGNYLVDNTGLAAVLDWEFAGWGDPYEDLGWMCARCWRFAAPHREAGGVADREALYAGYEAESGATLDRDAVPYWEVMAAVRWAVIAIQQAGRHVGGGETSLELALTGRRLAELGWDILHQTAEIDGKPLAFDHDRLAPQIGSTVEWPGPDNLLETTAGTVRDLAGRLSGRDRFLALMAANAIVIAGRDLALAEAATARMEAVLRPFIGDTDLPEGPGARAAWLDRRIAADLARGGLALDATAGGFDLRTALAVATAARLSLSNPKHLR